MQCVKASASTAVDAADRFKLTDFEPVVEMCATPGVDDPPPQPAAVSPNAAAAT
jgi:hypothetical protein